MVYLCKTRRHSVTALAKLHLEYFIQLCSYCYWKTKWKEFGIEKKMDNRLEGLIYEERLKQLQHALSC